MVSVVTIKGTNTSLEHIAKVSDRISFYKIIMNINFYSFLLRSLLLLAASRTLLIR